MRQEEFFIFNKLTIILKENAAAAVVLFTPFFAPLNESINLITIRKEWKCEKKERKKLPTTVDNAMAHRESSLTLLMPQDLPQNTQRK
jgi:predicted transglutaminase-like protease